MPSHLVGDATHDKQTASFARWLGLAAAYAIYFGLLATLQPYLTILYLEHGVAKYAVGAAVALVYVVAGLAPLFAISAATAHKTGVRRISAGFAGLALSVAALLLVGGGHLGAVGYVAAIALLTAAYAPLNALLDVSAVQLCERTGWSFGRLRLAGSLGYVATATGIGQVLPARGAVSLSVHAAVTLALAGVLATTLCLPPTRLGGQAANPADEHGTPHQPGRFALGCLLAACGLHYASFGPFQYGFTLYGQSVALGPKAIGVGWSLGVFSEVVCFGFAGTLLRRHGWRKLLLVAFLAAPIRWSMLAWLPTRATFFASQLLHGPAFAAFYAAAVAALGEVGPAIRAQRSLTLFAALVAGLACGPTMLLAGYAYAYLSIPTMFALMLPMNISACILLLASIHHWRLPHPAASEAPHPL